MASAFIRNFAIENNLTVDYGYAYGWYKNFYVSIKEGMTSKTLTINTKLGEDKELLKTVLSVFEKDLEKFCLTDNKFEDNYLQFTFNLNNDKYPLLIDFLDRFIDSYLKNDLKVQTYCDICKKPILQETQEVSTINKQGIIYPVHSDCFEKGKEKIQQKVQENLDKINKDKSTLKGFAGALIFSLIFVILLIGVYTLKESLLSEYSELISESGQDSDFGASLFHYLPCLLGLAAPFLICAGYDIFKGTKGNRRYAFVITLTYIATIVGIWFGFTLSIYFFIEGFTYAELVPQIIQIMKIYPDFRTSFVTFAVLTLVLTTVGIIIKFAGSKEAKDAEIATFDKLD